MERMNNDEKVKDCVDFHNQTKDLDEIINDINRRDEITLRDTIELMTSEDYKKRFIAEYMQTKIRYNNLHKMLIQLEAGTFIGFNPVSSITVLNTQKAHMGNYLKQLEIRAEQEHIKLPNI